MRFNENEEAVSPVIGVILMVAITVILAAVIAVFVFGMADDIQSGHTVAATSKVVGDNVLITFQGGADASNVDSFSATVYLTGGAINTSQVAVGPGVSDDNLGNITWTGPEVGQVMTLTGAAADGNDHFVVTALFNDGASQVLLDKTV